MLRIKETLATTNTIITTYSDMLVAMRGQQNLLFCMDDSYKEWALADLEALAGEYGKRVLVLPGNATMSTAVYDILTKPSLINLDIEDFNIGSIDGSRAQYHRFNKRSIDSVLSHCEINTPVVVILALSTSMTFSISRYNQIVDQLQTTFPMPKHCAIGVRLDPALSGDNYEADLFVFDKRLRNQHARVFCIEDSP
ncbi:hypothetical protein M0C34_04195 [Agarivorans sp. TSD2052]|uniref:hypothetical protein n=1 Tax=Agarivorans sp. TSD2052 TaxID=2937286 RepID=UPI00200E5E76|nr:hypothetical protein [Agarivorans sp. TSD2052]UPW19488.1 hypothetical protein M0C34_04195 [Agarivorans sp. TSD2052]